MLLFLFLVIQLSFAFVFTQNTTDCSGPVCIANITISFDLDFENTTFFHNWTTISNPPYFNETYDLQNPIAIKAERLPNMYFIPLNFQQRYYSAYETYAFSYHCLYDSYIGPECYDWKRKPWIYSENSAPIKSQWDDEDFQSLCCLDEDSTRGPGLHCLSYNYTNSVDQFQILSGINQTRIIHNINVTVWTNGTEKSFLLQYHTLDKYASSSVEANLTVQLNQQELNFTQNLPQDLIFFEDLKSIFNPLPGPFPPPVDTGIPIPHISDPKDWFYIKDSEPNLGKIGITLSNWIDQARCTQQVQMELTSTIDPNLLGINGTTLENLRDQFFPYRNQSVVEMLLDSYSIPPNSSVIINNQFNPSRPAFNIYFNHTVISSLSFFFIDVS